MHKGYILIFLAAFCVDLSTQQDEQQNSTSTRDGKALSVFQVVRFPNIACTGSSSLNGTCYTSSECTNKGGTSAGSCANGFGVCCTFTLGCGSRISENCTYFQSSTTPAAGQCGVTICKCSTDICQLRMDFNTFVIAGPSTLTLSLGYETGGSVTTAAGVAFNSATTCQTDTFTITGSPGGTPPVICGTNSGYHVYADADDSCNQLNFQLGQTGIGTTIPTRSWSIKITQVSCYDTNLAPSGCTQYFYGSTSGTINSFNWPNLVQLANQAQHVCIRRERSYCKICYSTSTITDFQVSGKTGPPTGKGFIAGSKCCGYGSTGKKTMGYDCVIIPGAAKVTSPFTLIANQAFCGAAGLLYTDTVTSKTGGKTVCSSQIPFKLDFLTDAYTQVAGKTRGFRLNYWQTTC